MKKSKEIKPGGVNEYIASCPPLARDQLNKIRTAINEIAPESVETVSYFQIPGYSYGDYYYNGMFVWFSFKDPYVRLHIIPPIIDNYKEKLKSYKTTKSVVSFPLDKELPILLIKELVRASIKVMKDRRH